MKCKEVKENLDAFLDGEIVFSEREKIASHLETCLSCQTEFEQLQRVSHSLRQNLPVTTPASLDAKLLSAFQDFHSQKQAVKTGEKREITGWFGIPRLAFAAAFLLLFVFSGLAFQLGRMSAGRIEVSMSEVSENKQQSPEIKIVEIPVVKEKILEVPVVKEKIVTRTVYVDKKSKPNDLPEDTFALNSSIKDGEFMTHTNLEGFQPVAEIKAKITKKEEKK